MGLANTPINSKTGVNCNNVEGDLISVHLEVLQNLNEYSKIRSNANLLNSRTEQVRNNMSNEVYSSIRIVDVSIRVFYGKKQKQENIIDDSCIKSTLFRSERKSINWKTH